MKNKNKVMLSSEKQSKKEDKGLLITIRSLQGLNVFQCDNEITNEGVCSTYFAVVFTHALTESEGGKYPVFTNDKRVADLINAMTQINEDGATLLLNTVSK